MFTFEVASNAHKKVKLESNQIVHLIGDRSECNKVMIYNDIVLDIDK